MAGRVAKPTSRSCSSIPREPAPPSRARRGQTAGVPYGTTDTIGGSFNQGGRSAMQVIAETIKPHMAIITDVTHDTGTPLMDKKRSGDVRCGRGPSVTYAPAVHNRLLDLIIDTAGRLHIDERMMAEVTEIKGAVSPSEILFVVDSMTGQDAVNTAKEFNERLDFDGVRPGPAGLGDERVARVTQLGEFAVQTPMATRLAQKRR